MPLPRPSGSLCREAQASTVLLQTAEHFGANETSSAFPDGVPVGAVRVFL
jgi:hypothetical protein